jgi:hypothetical protein
MPRSYGRPAHAAHMEDEVYLIIFAVLFLAWLAGVLVFQVGTGLIHVLFLLAALSLIAHLFQRKTVS